MNETETEENEKISEIYDYFGYHGKDLIKEALKWNGKDVKSTKVYLLDENNVVFL